MCTFRRKILIDTYLNKPRWKSEYIICKIFVYLAFVIRPVITSFCRTFCGKFFYCAHTLRRYLQLVWLKLISVLLLCSAHPRTQKMTIKHHVQWGKTFNRHLIWIYRQYNEKAHSLVLLCCLTKYNRMSSTGDNFLFLYNTYTHVWPNFPSLVYSWLNRAWGNLCTIEWYFMNVPDNPQYW